ncbi:MAG: outer membrane protein assembly factor [Roseomonas sp.]|nr:outer membrane protein assembly factor [Roseomonas sp.]
MIRPSYPSPARAATNQGWLLCWLLCTCLILANHGLAQEPPAIAYRVEITPRDDTALVSAIEAVSQLIRLEETAPTDAYGLLARARADLPRLAEALRAEGFWGGAARIEIAGQDVTQAETSPPTADPARPLPVAVILTPGPRYRIGQILIKAEPAEEDALLEQAAGGLRLAEGDPARPADILAAEEALRLALRRAGYPLASLAAREAVVDHDTKLMDITWRIAPGPPADFARPSVAGTTRTDPALLTRLAAWRLEGQPYSPERLERARRAMMGLGVFSFVRAQEAPALDEAGRLPVHFDVQERPRHVVGGRLGYETNYGLTAGGYWEDRNMLGGAERLRLEGEIARIGETGIENATFRAFATLRTPEFMGRDLQSVTQIGAVRERLRAYDRDAALASFTLEHRLSDTMAVAGGPNYEEGRIGRDGDMEAFRLFGLMGSFRYDNTTNPLDPRQGQRFSLSATPYYSAMDANSFTRILAIGTSYFDILGNGDSVLALRAALGSAPGANRDEITLDKRFYAGGGGSVRGYTYQSIGPRDAANRPLGGASLVEASVEWRQRLTRSLGIAAFVDAGSVGEEAKPDFEKLRAGTGLGLRYLTAIGPLRFDVGLPLDRQKDDPSFAIYIGFGQAF